MSESFRFRFSRILPGLFPVLCAPVLWGQAKDYNIKIGDLLLDFSANAEYAYSDNVTSVPDGAPDANRPGKAGPIGDWMLGYGLDMGIDWQITDNNTLGVSVGMSWIDYKEMNFLDSQRTNFSVNPDSEVDFSVLIGPVEARVYDRFGYSVEGSNSVRVDASSAGTPLVDAEGRPLAQGRAVAFEVDRYAFWENEIGVEALTILNPLEWTISLSRLDVMPDDNDGGEYVEELGKPLQDDRWEFTRRSEWILQSQLFYPLGRDNGVGIFGRYSENDYNRNILTDSKGWQVGVSAEWAFTERTILSATLGYDVRSFEESETLRFLAGGYADILKGKNAFYRFELLNLLGEKLNHKLSYARSIAFGRATNQQVVDSFAYDLKFQGIRGVELTGGFQWVTADDSGPAPFAEQYDLFLASIGMDIRLSSKLTSSLSYRFVSKDSNNNDRDFDQNHASVSLKYDF
jgi:hypothetical protein